MKKLKKLLFSALALGIILSACTEEPPPPPHPITGEWGLDAFEVVNINIVSGPYSESQLTVQFDDPIAYGGLWSITEYYDFFFDEAYSSYELTFNNDNTFLRRLGQLGADDTSEGTWEIDENTTLLILDIEGGTFDEEYTFESDILETEVTLQQLGVEPVYLLVYPDAILEDTLTSWSFETQERVLAVTAQVTLDVNYYFER